MFPPYTSKYLSARWMETTQNSFITTQLLFMYLFPKDYISLYIFSDDAINSEAYSGSCYYAALP